MAALAHRSSAAPESTRRMAKSTAPATDAVGNAARVDAMEGAEVEGQDEAGDAAWAVGLELGRDKPGDPVDPDSPELAAAAEDPKLLEKGEKESRRRGGKQGKKADKGDEKKTSKGAGGGTVSEGAQSATAPSVGVASPTSMAASGRPKPPSGYEGPQIQAPDVSLEDAVAQETDLHAAWSGGALSDVVSIDRDALLANAMGPGMGQAALSSGMTMAVDTALDVATSKIPFVSGFIEMGKMALDPKGWAAGIVGGFTNSFGSLSGLDMSNGTDIGVVADVVERIFDTLDGITHIVTMLTMVMTIGASLCFAFSWVPGLQFLAAIAAVLTSFAVLFGTVGTLMGLFSTMGHGILMNLRIAELKAGSDDPSDLLAAADSLEEHAGAFVGGSMNRAIDGGRTRVQKSKSPGKENAGATKASKGEALAGLAVGAVGGGDHKGKGRSGAFSGKFKDIKDQGKTAIGVTKAAAGKGIISRGNRKQDRNWSTKMADIELAGGTVYTSKRHRDTLTNKNRRGGLNDELSKNYTKGAKGYNEAMERRQEVDDYSTGAIDRWALSGPTEDHNIFSHQAMGVGVTGYGTGVSFDGDLWDAMTDRDGGDQQGQGQESHDSTETSRDEKLKEAHSWTEKTGFTVGYLDPDYMDKSVMDIVEEQKGPSREDLLTEAVRTEAEQLPDAPGTVPATLLARFDAHQQVQAESEALASRSEELTSLRSEIAVQDATLAGANQSVMTMQQLADATREELGQRSANLKATESEHQAKQGDRDAQADKAREMAGSGLMGAILDSLAKLGEMGSLGDKASKEGDTGQATEAGDATSLSDLVVQALDSGAESVEERTAVGTTEADAGQERMAKVEADLQTSLDQQLTARTDNELAALAVDEAEQELLVAQFAARDASETLSADQEAELAELAAWATEEHPAAREAAQLRIQDQFPYVRFPAA